MAILFRLIALVSPAALFRLIALIGLIIWLGVIILINLNILISLINLIGLISLNCGLGGDSLGFFLTVAYALSPQFTSNVDAHPESFVVVGAVLSK